MDVTGTGRVRLVVTMLVATALVLTVAYLWAPTADEPRPRPTGASNSGQPGQVCDAVKRGPTKPPAGAVSVDPDVDGDLGAKTRANPAGTTFWLRSGRHTLGSARFGQVIPKDGNTYLGARNAVLDGRGRNHFAFTQPASDVTIKYLTITGFAPPHNEGVVNHDSGDGWLIAHNTIEENSGAALMAGAGQRIRGNCLRDNGQYGINAFKQGNTITDLVIKGNEIVGNNTDDWERRREGCGCTGGAKLWAVDGADISGNWIHDNRGPGLWADVNNNDILIENNLIERNDNAAIIYETSYNAIIRDNVIKKNNWVEGRDFADGGDNFPSAAIYLSESGGEPRIPARTDRIDIYRNRLVDNWSGITAWENADRFCNSPANPTDDCTELVTDRAQCKQPTIAKGKAYADCRWKTQRVAIHDNLFSVDPAKIPGCEGDSCARMALLANYGTYPEWSPYHGEVVQQAITFDQDNRWYDNTYVGKWRFVAYGVERVLSASKWRAKPYGQDHSSTFR